jgi:hypothetical protein
MGLQVKNLARLSSTEVSAIQARADEIRAHGGAPQLEQPASAARDDLFSR